MNLLRPPNRQKIKRLLQSASEENRPHAATNCNRRQQIAWIHETNPGATGIFHSDLLLVIREPT
jgi:hypothetical protein